MTEDPEWFNTPMLQYLSMKKDFLGKFLHSRAWGEFGYREQVISITCLLDYYKKTMNLADQFPKLLNDVILDNKNLVLEHILPFPPKLYEQLLSAAVGDADEGYQMFWQQPSCVTLAKIENFLIKRKQPVWMPMKAKSGLK